MMLFLLLVACTNAPQSRGVYRAGANAVMQGAREGTLKVWGPDGTVERLASSAPGGHTFLGAAGPLWVVDHEVPAPARAPVVAAVMVERAGFRLQGLLGTTTTGAIDPALAGGVYVRSVLKVRRDKAPPVYVVSATGDEVGAGRMGGPADVRSGASCQAVIGTMDDRGDTLLSGHLLADATRLCAVPSLVYPVDMDGDGLGDVLAYGQNGNAGFRAWFTLHPDGTLVAGPAEVWEEIP